RMSEMGVWGRQPPPFNRSKKFFVKLFPKKVWAAESRLMKFPVSHNGRPMVAPTKVTIELVLNLYQPKSQVYYALDFFHI
ncbi:MAG: hypothetical protein ACI4JM_03530, partial [Oscillospiraceae bacterium]